MPNPTSEALAGWQKLLSSKVNEAVSRGHLRDHFSMWPTNQIPAIVCGQIAIAAGMAAKVWLATSGGKDSSGASLIVQGMDMDRLGNEIVDALIEDTEEFARDEEDPQRRRGYELIRDFMKRDTDILKAVVELSLEETQKPWSVDELSKSLSGLRSGKKQSMIRPDIEGYPADTTSRNFKQAYELNSDGWEWHERKLYKDALRFYDQAIALCPDFPMIWNNKGLAHFRLGDFEQARAAYHQAIKINSRFIKPYSNLGILYLELRGDKNEAAHWFRQALALDPDNERAKQYLTLCEAQGVDITVSSIHVKRKK